MWRAALGALVAVLVGQSASAQPGGMTFAGGEVALADIERALRDAHPDSMRPIGTSSVVYEVELAGPIDCAFKPASRVHPRGWAAEVMAYRVAQRLGIDSVPPAVVRRIERGQFRRRLEPTAGATVDELMDELVLDGRSVVGAAIYWVPDLGRISDLDRPAGILRWSAWLAPGAELPDESRALARDLSSMTVLDYVIGNFDRMSGGNVRTNGAGRLVIRDHNLALGARIGEGPSERMITQLMRARRFSRGVVSALLALDEDALRALALDAEGTPPLVDDAQIAAVMERRATVLSWIGALVEEHGAAEVLFFE